MFRSTIAVYRVRSHFFVARIPRLSTIHYAIRVHFSAERTIAVDITLEYKYAISVPLPGSFRQTALNFLRRLPKGQATASFRDRTSLPTDFLCLFNKLVIHWFSRAALAHTHSHPHPHPQRRRHIDCTHGNFASNYLIFGDEPASRQLPMRTTTFANAARSRAEFITVLWHSLHFFLCRQASKSYSG